MTSILSDLKKTLIPRYQDKKWIIAYSGGLDSRVLLHLVVHLKKQYPTLQLQVVHINHQLSPQADVWSLHCREICMAYDIPFANEILNIDLQSGESLEAKARLHRYQALANYIDQNSILLTAHHKNDQAETFLLQALRGSGPKGLCAMPLEKPFYEGLHVRPLLNLTRDTLKSFAVDEKLEWVNDESNSDERFDRNFVRHRIFPLLQEQFRGVVSAFARSASIAAQHEAVLQSFIEELFLTIKTDEAAKILLKPLLTQTQERQRLLLRLWLEKNNVSMPSEKQIKQIQQDVLEAREDATPCFYLGRQSIRRYRQCLYLVPELTPIDLNFEIAFNVFLRAQKSDVNVNNDPAIHKIFYDAFLDKEFVAEPQHASTGGVTQDSSLEGVSSQLLLLPLKHLLMNRSLMMGSWEDLIKNAEHLIVRHRRGGERIRNPHKKQRQTLKNFLQERGIPPWERERLLLVMDDDVCVGVFCDNPRLLD